MATTKTAFCAKHKAEYDKWADWGPWNPRPSTISQVTVTSQLKLIREAHENGRDCDSNPANAFKVPAKYVDNNSTSKAA